MAVRRCYENLRRTFLEHQSGKEDFVENQSKQRKYRSRRERKFQRRGSMTTEMEREKYWRFLNLLYVTEESDDPDNPNGIIEHKLLWRSDRLNEFMKILDDRFSNRQDKSPSNGLVAKKIRKEGSPSATVPPNDAPKWAVKTDTGDSSVARSVTPTL